MNVRQEKKLDSTLHKTMEILRYVKCLAGKFNETTNKKRIKISNKEEKLNGAIYQILQDAWPNEMKRESLRVALRKIPFHFTDINLTPALKDLRKRGIIKFRKIGEVAVKKERGYYYI